MGLSPVKEAPGGSACRVIQSGRNKASVPQDRLQKVNGACPAHPVVNKAEAGRSANSRLHSGICKHAKPCPRI